jgi:hypothetical protein
VFRDPQPPLAGVPASKSENPPGILDQDFSKPVLAPVIDPDSHLEGALRQLGSVIEGRLLLK